MDGCDHAGFWTPQSRLDKPAGTLRSVLLCDGCGAAMRSVGEQPYRPAPELPDAQAR